MEKYKEKNGIVLMLDGLGVRNMTIEECQDFLKKRDELVVDFENKRNGIQEKFQNLASKLDRSGGPEFLATKVDVPIPATAAFADTLVFTWEMRIYLSML